MPTDYVFAPPPVPALPVMGEDALFPVRRIFCVGRNYAAHAAEMGAEVDREAPWYVPHSAPALCQSGQTIAMPPATGNCHSEMELVVAIGAEVPQDAPGDATASVFGYGCGIDLTRRDLQAVAKEKRLPWDTGKDFENAAILGPLTRAAAFGPLGAQRIWLDHDGARVQDAPLGDMIWSVPDLISDLSRLYRLMPGDLIMTGTPAGVGPVHEGSRLRGGVEGLCPVEVTIRGAA